MDSQSEIQFQEILNVQKILVGWTTFFLFSTEIWAEQLKNQPVAFFSCNVKSDSTDIL